MNKITPLALTLFLIPTCYQTAQGADLITLIPNLYTSDGQEGITLAPPAGPFPSHAAHFTLSSSSVVNLLNSVIGQEIRSLPISSTPGGLSYRYDSEKGTYKLGRRNLGPVLAQSGQTLGKGNRTFAFTFTHFEYDEFNGEDISHLSVDTLHQFDVIDPDDSPQSFENDVVNILFDIDLEVESYTFYGAYGLTDNLDVSLTVPIVSVDMDVNALASVVVSPENPFPNAHQFSEEPNTDNPNDSASGSETGIGDVVIALKYGYDKGQKMDVATFLAVKLETGDEDNFLGTGSTTVQPAVFAEYEISDLWSVHGNLGYEWDTNDNDESTLRSILGVTVGHSKLTGSLEVANRYQPDGDDVGDDKTDLGIGLKWNPAQQSIVSASAVVPLNDDGLRSDLIVGVGYEIFF
ncbi:MAG: transporter [Amphritea sp.]